MTPAVAVVLTLALIAVAASSQAGAGVLPRGAESRHVPGEFGAARLVAVAVAAARDFLHFDQMSAIVLTLVPSIENWCEAPALLLQIVDCDAPHPTRLHARLLDLPPPIC